MATHTPTLTRVYASARQRKCALNSSSAAVCADGPGAVSQSRDSVGGPQGAADASNGPCHALPKRVPSTLAAALAAATGAGGFAVQTAFGVGAILGTVAGAVVWAAAWARRARRRSFLFATLAFCGVLLGGVAIVTAQ